MNREAFLDYLVRAVRDGSLNEGQAADLLRRLDAGEINIQSLPVVLAEPNATQTSAASRLAAVLDRLGVLDIWPFSETARQRALVALQQDFQAAARRLAAEVAITEDVAAWQQAMADLIATEMIEARILGTGGPLSTDELAEVDEQMATQLAFLSRFADQIQAQILLDDPLTAAAIGARSELYDRARGQFYRGLEISQGLGAGYVEDYQAVDDLGTCLPCAAAEAGSPYQIGEGPYPGEVCLGGGRCRCERVPRYAPEEAAA